MIEWSACAAPSGRQLRLIDASNKIYEALNCFIFACQGSVHITSLRAPTDSKGLIAQQARRLPPPERALVSYIRWLGGARRVQCVRSLVVEHNDRQGH
jgi:hypothetical protein